MLIQIGVSYECNPSHYEMVYNAEDVNSFFKCKRKTYEPQENETIFFVVRHGENESNVAGTYDGRTLNLPLTDKGLKQGKIAGEKIRNKVSHIDRVITSTMIRTDQTAKEILKSFPDSRPQFTKDDRILERYVGKYEGKPLSELEKTNKMDKKISASKDYSFEQKMKFSPEEGEIESYAAIWKRAHECFQETGSELKGKVVLAVTHSGTMRSIYWHLTNKLGFFVPYANFKPGNGAYMVISVKEGEMTLLETEDIEIISPKGK